MSTSAPTDFARRVCALLAPLDVSEGSDAPGLGDVAVLAQERLPYPARTLLAHEDGLTPTLERHWGRRLELDVLADRRSGSHLSRHVHLVVAGERRPVSFGAIRLDLERFSPRAHVPILAGRVPLGTILREHAVEHRRHVSGYFAISPARLPHVGLTTDDGGARLHGRHSVLVSPAGETMAEVVEILAPIDGDAASGF